MMVRPAGIRQTFKTWLRYLNSFLFGIKDFILRDGPDLPAVYIQRYFPTIPVIHLADKNKGMKIYLEDFAGTGLRKYIRHMLPVVRVADRHRTIAAQLLDNFDRRHHFALMIDEKDISDELYKILTNRIAPGLPNTSQP